MADYYVSEAMGLPITSHAQIPFVDVPLNRDTQLFVDPCLLALGSDEWSIAAYDTVQSFFDKLYHLYAYGSSREEKLQHYRCAREVNATRMGYGNGWNGKGTTPQGMLEALSDLEQLVTSLGLNHPMDLHIFIPNFAEDRMSDLLTNILFKALSEFTVDICRSYGIPLSWSSNQYYYWDRHSGDWQRYQGECLVLDGRLVLLVPKQIVAKDYYCDVEQYFRSEILDRLQAAKTTRGADGKEDRPYKKDIRAQIAPRTEFVRPESIRITSKNPEWLAHYRGRFPTTLRERILSDEKLDALVYGMA